MVETILGIIIYSPTKYDLDKLIFHALFTMKFSVEACNITIYL